MSDKRVLAMARKAAADSDDEEISDSGDLDFVSVKVHNWETINWWPGNNVIIEALCSNYQFMFPFP